MKFIIMKMLIILALTQPLNYFNDYKINQYKEKRESIAQELKEMVQEQRELKKQKKQEQVVYTQPSTVYYQPSTDEQLTAFGGVYYYGEQKETYYNLPMSQVVANAQAQGLEGEYWVRDDGVKMYGDYVIIAANQNVYPYGTVVDTSLGEGIVLDTGGFAASNPTQVDIATDW